MKTQVKELSMKLKSFQSKPQTRKENRFKQKAEIESKQEIPVPEVDQEGVKDILEQSKDMKQLKENNNNVKKGNKTILPSNEAQFLCNICNKHFAKEVGLNRHMLKHSKKMRPYLCKICKCSFKIEDQLEKHIQIVHGKSFKCEFENCGKAFGKKSDLIRHMNRHTGKKPYKCKSEDCEQWFADQGTRNRHSKRVCNITVTRNSSCLE